MQRRLPVHVYHAGYDILWHAPGEVLLQRCPTCGDEMEVTRDVVGPTSWGEAMARGKHRHDKFVCPHASTRWHQRAMQLRVEAGGTVSRTLRRMIEAELAELIRARPEEL
jgi:hypothetical protein